MKTNAIITQYILKVKGWTKKNYLRMNNNDKILIRKEIAANIAQYSWVNQVCRRNTITEHNNVSDSFLQILAYMYIKV
jgi:hypothetical protein